MAYIKPPMFVRRIFNPLAMQFGVGGAARLSVAGRKSGAARSVPVIPVEHAGSRYLVSTRGEAEWVRNLRAAGGHATLKDRAGAREIRTSEVPAAEREPILAAYRQVAGKTVDAYFNSLPEPGDHPVFRIEAS
jgi:deazaflavin-dependent oxidoreductase (nitroreductase family)